MEEMSAVERKRLALQRKLLEIERQIEAVEKRLPAHSVKPPMMMELFDLEEQRDHLLKELEALEQ